MRRITLFLILPSLALAASFAGAQTAKEKTKVAKEAIFAAYNRRAESLRKRDVRSYMAVCTADFVSRGADGKERKRKEAESQTVRTLAMLGTVTNMQTRAGIMLPRAGEAVVDVTTTAEVVVNRGKPQPVGPTPIRIERRSRDYWVLVGTEWKLKRSEAPIRTFPSARSMSGMGVTIPK